MCCPVRTRHAPPGIKPMYYIIYLAYLYNRFGIYHISPIIGTTP